MLGKQYTAAAAAESSAESSKQQSPPIGAFIRDDRRPPRQEGISVGGDPRAAAADADRLIVQGGTD